MDAFTFTAVADLQYFEVQFAGELIGGSTFESDKFQKLAKQIRTEAESRIVFINLNKVTFWDTEGMRQTLGLAHELNQKHGKRVHIIAPMDGYLHKRAQEKYKDKFDRTVFWITSKEGLV